MPPYIPHGWKYLAFDKNGWLYVAFGPPCNVCLPPTSTSQVRHINPANGTAEIVALGVRNSVGGDVDPRTGDYWFTEHARDWLGEDIPSDKLNHISRLGEHFGYPYCHQGDIPDPKFAMGHKCSEFAPPVLKLGPHVAALGMKFYTGNQFPADYKNSIIIAEHGSWNRHNYLGGRLVRVIVDPEGKTAKEDVVGHRMDRARQQVSRPAQRCAARRRTARSWLPMITTAPSTGSATASDPSRDRFVLIIVLSLGSKPETSGLDPAFNVSTPHASNVGVCASYMTRIRFSCWLWCCLVCRSVPGTRAAADLAAGKAAAEGCAGCHGEDGISHTPLTPSLAGEPDDFTQWQLVFFRGGSRKSEVMGPIAAALNNEEIRNLGAYYASLPPPKPEPRHG